MEDEKKPAVGIRYGKNLTTDSVYLQAMGFFQTSWSGVELSTDFAIYKFLRVTAEQSHLITSGMMFGRKARLLADLIKRSGHPNKQKILNAFNKVRGGNMRDVFAHGYISANKDTVVFLERSAGGDFKSKPHVFTIKEFLLHVGRFVRDGEAFAHSLEIDPAELRKFTDAAMNLENKSATSPDKPTS
jgi:hypothetical protein